MTNGKNWKIVLGDLGMSMEAELTARRSLRTSLKEACEWCEGQLAELDADGAKTVRPWEEQSYQFNLSFTPPLFVMFASLATLEHFDGRHVRRYSEIHGLTCEESAKLLSSLQFMGLFVQTRELGEVRYSVTAVGEEIFDIVAGRGFDFAMLPELDKEA